MRPARNLTIARASDAQLRAELKARGYLVITRKVVAAPKCSKPVAKRNANRAKATYARNFGERGAAVRAMGCVAAVGAGGLGERFACDGSIEAAHVRARGMGGAKGDRRCLVGLCTLHHRLAGEHRTTKRAAFELIYGINLDAEAERISTELDERGLP